MKFMMKITIPVDSGNHAAVEGNLGSTIKAILDDLKPEAAYFTAVDGCRGGYVFFDMEDASQIPAIVEPWFLAFDANVEISVVMTPDKLAAAADSSTEAV